jgi:hypothetical protein
MKKTKGNDNVYYAEHSLGVNSPPQHYCYLAFCASIVDFIEHTPISDLYRWFSRAPISFVDFLRGRGEPFFIAKSDDRGFLS